MAKEIERQFLLKELPSDLQQYECLKIQQGYLAVDEHKEVRVRSMGYVCTLTVKEGQGLVRSETEIELTKEQFEKLWPATGTNRIEKERFIYCRNSQTIFIDTYLGPLSGFNVAEVEFEDEKASQAFEVPPDFGEEITEYGSFYYLKKRLLAGLNESN